MSWTLIESQTLGSSVASVTLGNGGTLPQTYKTLKLVVSVRTDRSNYFADQVVVKPNGSTANATERTLSGDGSAASSGTDTRITLREEGNSPSDSNFGSGELVMPNYASTSANKPMSSDSVAETNGSSGALELHASLWSSTNAITSLSFSPSAGTNFLANSSFTLYGLK